MEGQTGQPRRSGISRRGLLGGLAAGGSLLAAYAALGGSVPLGPLTIPAPPDESAALARESVRISHLLRRAGFGVSRAEFEHYQSLGLEGTIDELINYGRLDDRRAEVLAEQADFNRIGPALWWLIRMANTRRPLQEKMTLFWHGLLTTEISAIVDAPAMVRQNEFLRRNAMGEFRELLHGISLDPAMMVYLDTDESDKSSPNENYARELMELFSMGVGNFSEQDVKEASRAFTGWIVPRNNPRNIFSLGEPEFHPDRFDAGQKTFLGRTGSFRHNDIVDIVLEQPATARYITRRLFAFFVYPDPSEEELAPFVELYRRSGGSIRAVVESLLRSEVFYSPRAYRALAKSPVEFAVGAIKALGLQENVPSVLPRRALALRNMGQTLFDPPNVAGWPGGRSWFSSSTLLARLNFLNELVAFNASPVEQGMSLGTAEQALAHFLPFLLDDNIPDAARRTLLDFAGGPLAQLEVQSLRGLVYLMLASPQYQLS